MRGLYILDSSGAPVRELDIHAWSTWLSDHPGACIVGRDQVDAAIVSTIFLAMDRNFANFPHGGHPPILYETVIFGGPHDMRQWRYCTRWQAVAGHDQIIAALREGTDPQ